MRRRWHILPGGPVKAGKSHSHLLARAMGAVNTGHLADDDPDDSTSRHRSLALVSNDQISMTGPAPNILVRPTQKALEIMIK